VVSDVRAGRVTTAAAGCASAASELSCTAVEAARACRGAWRTVLRIILPVMVADGGLRVLVVSTERSVGAMELTDTDASGSDSPNFM